MNTPTRVNPESSGHEVNIYPSVGIISIVFLFWMALQLYVPTLSIYIQNRTSNLALTGYILSTYGLMGLLIRLPLGIVTDWIGRCKLTVIFGMVMAGVGALLMVTSNSPMVMAAGRALTGLAAGAWVPMLVMYSNLFPVSKVVKSAAVLTVVLSLSRMLATSLTGWLNNVGGYPLAFYLSAGIAGLAILILFPIKESPRLVQKPSLGTLKKIFSRQDVILPSLLNIIGQYVGVTAVYSFGPILAQQLGASNVTLSAMATWNLFIYTVGNLLAASISRHISHRKTLLGSFFLMAAGLGILALAPSVVWIFIAHACYGMAGGFSYPVLMGLSIQKVSAEERSTAMGIHQSVYTIGTFAGPALSGVLAKSSGIQPMFGITALGCLVLGVLGVRWLFRDRAQGRNTT